MTYASTFNAATRLKPELILQTLGGIKKPETEVIDNVFKNKKNVRGNSVTREIITRTIKSIPFVGQNNQGVILNGKTILAEGITTPPMKAHLKITASDLQAVKDLNGTEYRAWLSEEMVYIKNTIAWAREWFARSFLTTGNCSYPFLVGEAYETLTYALGTMTAVSAPAVVFDHADATLEMVVLHLDAMLEAGRAIANRNHFQDASKILVYARTAVWNAIFNLLDGKQTNSSSTGRRVDIDTLDIGGYIIKKFDAAMVNAETQAAANGFPVKTMRMIDVNPSSAPHTMAALEIVNLKATGGQKHVFINVVVDPYGEFVDIQLQHRPVGMLIPEAMVNSDVVLA